MRSHRARRTQQSLEVNHCQVCGRNREPISHQTVRLAVGWTGIARYCMRLGALFKDMAVRSVRQYGSSVIHHGRDAAPGCGRKHQSSKPVSATFP